MNHIFKDISVIFSKIGIFPSSTIILSKLCNLKNTEKTYEEIEIIIDENTSRILPNKFYISYPELLKITTILEHQKIISYYRENGELHNINKPARLYYDITGKILEKEEYYENGELYRKNKPALISYFLMKNETQGKIEYEEYYEYKYYAMRENPNKLSENIRYSYHRKKNSEIEIKIQFLERGKIHRDSGPAIIYYNKNRTVYSEEYYNKGNRQKIIYYKN